MADDVTREDEDLAVAAALDDEALLGVAGDDAEEDPPAPETGLHALGQLGTAIVVVGALLLIGIAVAATLGRIFG
jgi:hypothetical protein